MGKEDKDRERIEAVLQILRKQMSLTVKQVSGSSTLLLPRPPLCRDFE